jgi:hypothetical protein
VISAALVAKGEKRTFAATHTKGRSAEKRSISAGLP